MQTDVNKRVASEQARSCGAAQRLKDAEAVNRANESLIEQLMARLTTVEAQVSPADYV